jgi:hypothetical protein
MARGRLRTASEGCQAEQGRVRVEVPVVALRSAATESGAIVFDILGLRAATSLGYGTRVARRQQDRAFVVAVRFIPPAISNPLDKKGYRSCLDPRGFNRSVPHEKHAQ